MSEHAKLWYTIAQGGVYLPGETLQWTSRVDNRSDQAVEVETTIEAYDEASNRVSFYPDEPNTLPANTDRTMNFEHTITEDEIGVYDPSLSELHFDGSYATEAVRLDDGTIEIVGPGEQGVPPSALAFTDCSRESDKVDVGDAALYTATVENTGDNIAEAIVTWTIEGFEDQPYTAESSTFLRSGETGTVSISISTDGLSSGTQLSASADLKNSSGEAAGSIQCGDVLVGEPIPSAAVTDVSFPKSEADASAGEYTAEYTVENTSLAGGAVSATVEVSVDIGADGSINQSYESTVDVSEETVESQVFSADLPSGGDVEV